MLIRSPSPLPLLQPIKLCSSSTTTHNSQSDLTPTAGRTHDFLPLDRSKAELQVGSCNWEAEVVAAMAQVLKEVADLGFVIAFRFYGRYPETGRSFYHPPLSENRNVTEAEDAAVAENGRRRRQRLGLVSASSLILPSLSAPSLAEFFASGDFRDIEGVLPSPSALSVGAH